MLVQQILKSKADDRVMTIRPDQTVAEAAALLAEKRIGCLVVSEDGVRAVGILSERDIVREVAKRGGDCLSERIDGIMTRKLVTCTTGERADQVLRKMTDGRFRHLPVVEDAQMVGMISIGDVVKARLAELAMEKDALQGMIMGH